MKSNKLKKELSGNIDVLVAGLAKLANTNAEPLLNITEEVLLRLLLENRRSLSIDEIKIAVKLDAFQVSRVLKALEDYRRESKKSPLIKRSIDPHDKRHRRVSITANGKQVLKEKLDGRAHRFEVLFAPLNEDDLIIFNELVKKMRQGLDEAIKNQDTKNNVSAV